MPSYSELLRERIRMRALRRRYWRVLPGMPLISDVPPVPKLIEREGS